MSKVHETIRSIRTAKGLKQEEVATKLSMAQSNYARLEKGLTQITIDRLEQLAEVFEMSITSILSYEIDQQPNSEDNEYYINLCKKYEKQIDVLKKRVEELEEESLNDWSQSKDELKQAKAKVKELNERLKEKERSIKVLEIAISALSNLR